MITQIGGVTFVDPDNPPPGLDLTRLPVGVDVNDLIAAELVSDGELAVLAGDRDPWADDDDQQSVDLRDTAAAIQEIVDAYCFDPSNPEP